MVPEVRWALFHNGHPGQCLHGPDRVVEGVAEAGRERHGILEKLPKALA